MPTGGFRNPRGGRGRGYGQQRQYYNPYGQYVPGFGFVPSLPAASGATPTAPSTGSYYQPSTTSTAYPSGYGYAPPATGTYTGQQTMPRFGYGYSLGSTGYGAVPTGGGGGVETGAGSYQPWGQSLLDQLQNNYWGTRNQYGMSGLNASMGQASGGSNWGAFNRYGTPMGGEVGSSLGAVGLTPFGGRRRANVYGVTPNPNNPAGYGSHPYSTHDRPSKTRYAESYNRQYPWMGTGGPSGGTTAPAWMTPMTMWR